MKLSTLKLAPSIVTLLLFPLFVYLGFWQLERGTEKKRLQANIVARKDQKPLSLSDISHPLSPQTLDEIRYRTLTVTGTFLNEQTLLLDNQSLKTEKQPHPEIGYQVITPFQPHNSDKLILVNRGWIPLGKNRQSLPIIPPIHGEITLLGMVNQPSNGLSLGRSQQTHPQPDNKRIQRIDYNAIASELKQNLYPFLLTLKPKDTDTFQAMPFFFPLSAERHLAYAVQWFMMSLAVLVYHGVIRYRRRVR